MDQLRTASKAQATIAMLVPVVTNEEPLQKPTVFLLTANTRPCQSHAHLGTLGHSIRAGVIERQDCALGCVSFSLK